MSGDFTRQNQRVAFVERQFGGRFLREFTLRVLCSCFCNKNAFSLPFCSVLRELQTQEIVMQCAKVLCAKKSLNFRLFLC